MPRQAKPAMTGAERARRFREARKTGLKEKAKVIASTALEEGITPLEVMLRAMRNAWNAGDEQTAVARAKDAAPYVHPRLAATEVTGKDGGAVKFENVTDEDRVAALASFMARTGAALPKPKETEH